MTKNFIQQNFPTIYRGYIKKSSLNNKMGFLFYDKSRVYEKQTQHVISLSKYNHFEWMTIQILSDVFCIIVYLSQTFLRSFKNNPYDHISITPFNSER